MNLRDESSPPTLARKLGDVPHVSGLAMRLARATAAGERLPQWLMRVAVQRGAKHYNREFDPALPPDNPSIPDEEIAIALCLEQHPYNLDQLRIAAQLLSSRRVNTTRLCHLAVQERCEPVLLHIAAIAAKYAPNEEPWASLRKNLKPRPVPRTDVLPHWSRVVSHTSITRDGSGRTDWLRRDE